VGKAIEANTDIEIIEHNPHWIVVNKPAPLIAHPIPRKVEPSLSEEVRTYAQQWGYSVDHISLITRLDRETSGVTLIAIDKAAARIFGKGMHRRAFSKTYQAIVFGWPTWDQQHLNLPLIQQSSIEPCDIWVKQIPHPSGKNASTTLEVLERFTYRGQPLSLLKLTPHTGRTHQLRVHCQALGHPIVGDKLYNKEGIHYLEFIESGWNSNMERDLICQTHALHASQLEFAEGIWTWTAPLPRLFTEMLQKT